MATSTTITINSRGIYLPVILVCLDTNSFHENWYATGESFTLLGDLISKKKCKVYVSEVAVLEHVRHYAEKSASVASALKNAANTYEKLLEGKVTLPTELPSTEQFEKRFRKCIKELGIEVLPIPGMSHVDIVKRDLKRKKPFDPDGKGYRDTLCWLGFLNVIDESTSKVIYVTNDAKDHCDSKDETTLHSELIADIRGKNRSAPVVRFPAPQVLVKDFVKPLLKEIADEDAAAQTLFKAIQNSKYKYFELEDVVVEALGNFSAQESSGTFIVESAGLEGPLWVTSLEDPKDVIATALYRLSNGHFVCEGAAEVTATVEGFLDKFEAFDLSERGKVFISDPTWNDHYSEVELSNVPARISFSFEFEPKSTDILRFEVNDIDGIHPWER